MPWVSRTQHRVLNLIHAGPAAIGAIGLFGVVIPGLLYGLALLFDAAHMPSHVLCQWMALSLLIGGVLLAVFILLLIVEQIQDAVLYQAYQRGRGKRLRLADGRSECPFCGCRTLRDFEYRCPVCGKALE